MTVNWDSVLDTPGTTLSGYWTEWRWNGDTHQYCRCSTCWSVFKRPMKWTRLRGRWFAEDGHHEGG